MVSNNSLPGHDTRKASSSSLDIDKNGKVDSKEMEQIVTVRSIGWHHSDCLLVLF